jgi:hypothetical protein
MARANNATTAGVAAKISSALIAGVRARAA